MSNGKKKEFSLEDSFFTSLAKEIGGDVLDDLDKTRGLIDTGILGLNYAISGKFVGGGLPMGICAEVFGGSSSGKTLIGTNLLRGCQIGGGVPVFLDAEKTINKQFAVKASHLDPKKLLVIYGDTLERAFNKIFNVIRKIRHDWEVPIEKPIVIVYDSIAVSPSEREFAETELDMETATKAEIKEAGAGADKPGERARICSKELRKLTPYLQENNATVLFINQERMKIGVMFGNPRTGGGGGMALPYYCSSRIELFSSKRIKNANGKVIGVNISLKTVKNKISIPFIEVSNTRLLFEQGIDCFSGLLELLLMDGRISGSGNYVVNEKYSDGKEVKFKGNKERNDMPMEVLLSCPKLIDAETKEQVEHYITAFGSAMEGLKGDISEEDIHDDE